MPQWYQCPKCGASIPFGSRFCGSCGTQLNWQAPQQSQHLQQHLCPQCSSTVSSGEKWCGHCGAALSWQEQQQSQPAQTELRKKTSHSANKGATGFLKAAGISIISFLLFVALLLFGPAFVISQTILSPDFVNSQVNRIEIASLANDLLAQNTSDGMPEEIGSALSSTIKKIEPQLKTQLNTAINSVYTYLLGRKESPELSQVLRDTFLSSDFITAVIDEIDIASLSQPFIQEQVEQQVPQEMAFLSPYITSAIDKMTVSQEPYIKEQLKAAAEPIADFLTGKRQDFQITISTQPFLDELRTNLLSDIGELTIPGMELLPPELIEQGFDTFFNQFAQNVPAEIVIDETIIGREVPQSIAASLQEAEDALLQVRGYISYFQTAFILLIIFMLVMAAGIILIYRDLKKAARTLGIIFLIYGVIDLISFLIINNVIGSQIGQMSNDVPASLQIWLQQFINNALTPLEILSIGFIIGGIVLVVVSIFYKQRYKSAAI